MDAILSSAIEEVCLEGPAGVSPPKLWTLLQPSLSSHGLHLCDPVKNSIWTRLVSLPGLHFEAHGSLLNPHDPKLTSLADAEAIGVKVTAVEHLRDSCLGIVELKAGGRKFSALQRGILERIARSRGNGVTQDQLGKEFGIHGKEIFYHLKGLESNGVIIRQSTLVKKGVSIVNTNILYLTRYAGKHLNLNSHQRVEITRGSSSGACEDLDDGRSVSGGVLEGIVMEEDVSVRDYLPEMEAVCNKLEQASGKVLVVSDLKRELGYRKTKGHRLWRNIVNRLKEANLVEEFQAKVNGDVRTKGRVEKPNTCLRLLKKFNSKDFQSKTLAFGYDNSNSENHTSYHEKKGHSHEQVTELPLDHQIYDMIDGEGSKGMIVTEVYRRLGINGKKNYPRILDMRSRFEMPMLAECHNKTKVYRIWTFRNSPHNHHHTDISTCAETLNSNARFPAENELNFKTSFLSSLEAPAAKDGPEYLGSSNNHKQLQNRELVSQFDGSSEACDVVRSDVALLERTSLTLADSSKIQPSQRHPCLDLTSVTLQRKERIISRLETERFILLVELQRWLDSLETEKSSKMDKRTLLRLLESLERDGLCRHIEFKFPSLTNHSSDRQISVVFHPSYVASISENLGQIHKKFRDFDSAIRGKGLFKPEGTDGIMPQIINIERSTVTQEIRHLNSEAMRNNGFIPAKMIRAKLLHIFFWSFLRKNTMDDGGHSYDIENSHGSLRSFALDRVIKDLPVELFLQVVGFSGINNDLVEYCQSGLKLSDLQVQEYKCLMDINATSRLSSLVDVLIRLKLIQLVAEENAANGGLLSHVSVSHALEMKPYIEVPCDWSCSKGRSSDLRTTLRRNFNFLERVNVDDYWMALEGYYTEADSNITSYTFPGSAVREGFSSRSWSLVRVMTTEQRLKLYKRIATNDPSERVSIKKCRDISEELNLPLGQVLCASYDRRNSHFRRSACYTEQRELEELEMHNNKGASQKKKVSSQKRKRSVYNFPKDIDAGVSADPHICDFNAENDVGQSFGGPTCEIMEFGTDDSKVNNAFINQCVFPNTTKRRKFLWNDELDRQLVMQYTKYRAARKAELHRVSWASVTSLPANPQACRKRMAQLKGITSVRNAIMNLCNILGERYLRYINETSFDSSMKVSGGSLLGKGPDEISSSLGEIPSMPREVGLDTDLQLGSWDNFEDPIVKVAVEEVIRCKNIDKQRNSIESGSRQKRKCPGSPIHDEFNTEENHITSTNAGGRRRLCAHRIPRRILNYLSNKNIGTSKHLSESLAVANAVELLKLVFLNTSASSDVQTLLVDTLRQYSECDIYAAFNYLREKQFMVVGYGSRPLVLSQKFLNNATYSPFPVDSGRKAVKFSNWLGLQVADDIELASDLHCGEIFLLFALVSARRLSISVLLPEEGIGEAEDSLSNQKEKASSLDEIKKNDFLWKKDSDFCLRREKGFPGIKVVLHCLRDSECMDSSMHEDNAHLSGERIQNTGPPIDVFDPSSFLGDTIPDSLWQTMANYGKDLSLGTVTENIELSSNLIKVVYTEIQQAGDQGLNLEELTGKKIVQGNTLAKIITDTLETFQLIVKVNGYDCVRVVDSSHKSKYFIAIPGNHEKECKQHPPVKSHFTNCEGLEKSSPLAGDQITQKIGTKTSAFENCEASFHDSPKELEESCMKIPGKSCFPNPEGCVPMNDRPTKGTSCKFRPILPWIDANGCNDTIFYRGLVRRVVGIVMQNPGILEEDLIRHMDVLNPQSCRKLLDLLIVDNHITVRKIAAVSAMPPSILHGIMKFVPPSEPVFRRHLFANPMSTQHL